MQPRFSASDAWISAVVGACSATATSARAAGPAERRVARVVSVVCGHSVLADDDAFVEGVCQAFRASGAGRVAASPAGFLASAGAVRGRPAQLRSSGARIRTGNAFSRDFLAPGAARVVPALRKVFSETGNLPHGFESAAARYFLLLTVHPFVDGNGRTCRAHFASTVGQWIDGPAMALSLAWLHQDRNRQFHLLAKMARLGDFAPLLSFLADGRPRVRERFGASLGAVGAALASEDLPGVLSGMFQVRHGVRDLLGH